MKFKTSKRLFAHVDCDSFFASCEVYVNPRLRWKPVCVWWEIIVACTYEAKALGIKTWTPIWEAKRILKDTGVFLPVNFELYWKISKKLMKLLEDNSASMERFSVDEAFIDITWLPEYYNLTPERFAIFLQAKIKKEIWVPVSIWIWNTKLRAKILSDVNKPYGVCDGSDLNVLYDIFSKLPIKDIPFIWKASQDKLKYAVSTISDFKASEFWWVKEKLWKNWANIWLELNWVSTFKVAWYWKLPKSITRTRSFNKNITNNPEFLKQEIILNLWRAMEELTDKKMEVKTLSLYLKTKWNVPCIKSLTLSEWTLDRVEITKNLSILFSELFSPGELYRSTWIFFSDLRIHTPKQLSLLEINNENFERKRKLETVIEKMNKKFWKGMIWVGI